MKMKLATYSISVILIIVSFVLPPQGQIDSSVLMAVGLLIGGYEWLFGTSIRNIDIDKNGIHIESFKNEE